MSRSTSPRRSSAPSSKRSSGARPLPAATPDSVRRQISTGTLAPVYLLIGDDEIESHEIADAFADAIDPGLQAFNVERFHGTEAGAAMVVDQVVNAARTLPLVGERRIVALVRAEKVLAVRRRAQTGGDGEAEAARQVDAASARLEPLVAYLQSPEPRTTLVIVAADIDRGSRVGKALVRHAVIVECWGLKEGRELKSWDLPRIFEKGQRLVQSEARKAKLSIDARAAQLVARRAGADIVRLRGDISRLLLYAMGRERITEADVVEVIGPATSQDDWAVTTAIEQGDTAAALRELGLALEAGAPPPLVLGQLAWFVRDERKRYQERRIPAAVDALFRTDLDLKTSRGDARVLLERLVVELCAPASLKARPTY